MVYLVLARRCLVGATFLVSAASKLRTRSAFRAFVSWPAAVQFRWCAAGQDRWRVA
jgi:hypothetical protein